jgi:hypothetical protein
VSGVVRSEHTQHTAECAELLEHKPLREAEHAAVEFCEPTDLSDVAIASCWLQGGGQRGRGMGKVGCSPWVPETLSLLIVSHCEV